MYVCIHTYLKMYILYISCVCICIFFTPEKKRKHHEQRHFTSFHVKSSSSHLHVIDLTACPGCRVPLELNLTSFLRQGEEKAFGAGEVG